MGTRLLRSRGIEIVPRFYAYEDHGGTRRAAEQLDIPEHAVIKTLVFESGDGQPLLVLMHGDREVSTRQLARTLGVRSVRPCDPAAAHQHTGYRVGGISPFGTRRALPLYVERSILDLALLYVNGGTRGFLVELTPADLRRAVPLREVDVGIAR